MGVMLLLWLGGQVVGLIDVFWLVKLGYYLGFHPEGYTWWHYPWGVLTYAWWHRDFFSLGLNLLFIYGLGGLYEGFDTGCGFLRTFVWGSLAGALCYALSSALASLFGVYLVLPLSGASAGICALAFRLAMAEPRLMVRLMGLRLPFLGLILFIYLLSSLLGGANVGGILAHLGGALYGLARACRAIRVEKI